MPFTREFVRKAAKESGVEIPKELEDVLIQEHLSARDAFAEAKVKAALEENKPADPVPVKESDEYKALLKDFEDYKAEQTGKEAKAAKAAAYRELAKQAGVGEKWLDTVVKVATNTGVIDAMEMEGDKAKDAETLVESIKSEFSDFVGTARTDGVKTATPPASTGGGKTKAEILDIKDTAERQQAIAENPELFGI